MSSTADQSPSMTSQKVGTGVTYMQIDNNVASSGWLATIPKLYFPIIPRPAG